MKTLAERVKKERLELNLSQSQLADKIGISYMNIANLETGRVENPRYLSLLAEALQTTVSYLVDGTTAKKVEIDAPMYLVALTENVEVDPNFDYWIVKIQKDEKLFLTDSAQTISKIKKSFK